MGSFSIYKIKKRRKYALIGREYNIVIETVRASNTEGFTADHRYRNTKLVAYMNSVKGLLSTC